MSTVLEQKTPDHTADNAAFFQGEFQLDGWNIIVLQGPARLLEDVEYISFTGDFGFRYSFFLPAREYIADHITSAGKLFSHFDANILNLEFILPGIGSDAGMDRIAEFEAYLNRHNNRPSSPGMEREDCPRGNAKWYLYLESLMIDVIRQIPFGVVTLANNHALDYGPKAIGYNEQQLRKVGAVCFGTTQTPCAQLPRIAGSVIVYSMTDLVDRQDAEHLIARLDEANIDEAKKHIQKSGFAVAFMHVKANRSAYPSPYELDLVDKLIDAGFKLIVCTGSHWIKGYESRRGVPVFYGTGNYLFPFTRDLTEREGMHVVAGLRQGRLAQLFVVPFSNKFESGNSGPLKGADLHKFRKVFQDRSKYNHRKFFSDDRNLYELKRRIRETRLSSLKHIRESLQISDALVLLCNLPAILNKGKLGISIIASIIFFGWILSALVSILTVH
jgi:hypothetical protein